MRHSRNLRSTLRARPQTRQRRTVRVMNFGNKLHEATKLDTFATIAEKVRARIAAVDRRMAD